MSKSSAYFEGQEAFIDETHNPYATGSLEWKEWERGWLDEKTSIDDAIAVLDWLNFKGE